MICTEQICTEHEAITAADDPKRLSARNLEHDMDVKLRHLFWTLCALLLVAPAAASGVTEVSGVTAAGAQYLFQVPDGDAWNGRVVFYSHGYQLPSSFPEPFVFPQPFLDGLVDLGFAVAQSSYSSTGWATKQGIAQTHQLRGLFTSEFGQPLESYLLGRSMGGQIVLALAEKYPKQYAAAMPICGVVGGTHLTIDQIGGMRAAFDVYYPGVLPGNTLSVPSGLTFDDAAAAVQAAVLADPAPALQIGALAELDINAADFFELFLNILIRVGVQVDGTNDLLSRSQGHNPFDNLATTYSDPVFDASVERFTSTPDAERYYDRYYEPEGTFEVPVLSLHTTRDPLVPVEHEDRLAASAAAAGNSDLLVQRTVDRFGHCTFTDEEVIQSFLDLVEWAEGGAKPTGGDATIP